MILERIEGGPFSRVLPAWRGLTVAILAGGPSLNRGQVETVKAARETGSLRVAAVNDAYLLAPWADVHYAADVKWHRWHTEGIAKPMLGLTASDVRSAWASFGGQRCSIAYGGEYLHDERVHILRNAHEPIHGKGLSLDPERLVTGRNSGFQALNLATLAGATKVILLGFDGGASADGRTHWHGGHQSPQSPAVYRHFRDAMSSAERDLEAAGVTVVNCSPGSMINSFPKVSLEEALA